MYDVSVHSWSTHVIYIVLLDVLLQYSWRMLFIYVKFLFSQQRLEPLYIFQLHVRCFHSRYTRVSAGPSRSWYFDWCPSPVVVDPDRCSSCSLCHVVRLGFEEDFAQHIFEDYRPILLGSNLPSCQVWASISHTGPSLSIKLYTADCAESSLPACWL